jgi:anti-sigma regulatory factor (Ser/Thr protein kinase)
MISDILSILKFITDAQTRDTVKAIAQATSKKQSDWKKHVFVMKGKFKETEWINIDAFTNDLFQRVKDTGISETKFRRFTSAYSELIDNAYQHGGLNAKKGIVSINCIYSKWFIQIEIKDNGNRFDLYKSLEKVRNDREQGLREGKSGLELVRELCDKVEIRKSCVIAVIAGEDRMQILSNVEKFGNTELLEVTVIEDEQWSFLPPSWETFRDAIEKASQPIILVRVGKMQSRAEGNSITTAKEVFFVENNVMSAIRRTLVGRRKMRPIIVDCALNKNHYYAYVMPDRWVYDDLKELETNNLKFFRNVSDANAWLKECAMHVK